LEDASRGHHLQWKHLLQQSLNDTLNQLEKKVSERESRESSKIGKGGGLIEGGGGMLFVRFSKSF
jgi:hypothetical protein